MKKEWIIKELYNYLKLIDERDQLCEEIQYWSSTLDVKSISYGVKSSKRMTEISMLDLKHKKELRHKTLCKRIERIEDILYSIEDVEIFEIIHLRYVEGESLLSIAHRIDKSQSTIQRRIKAGLIMMLEFIEKNPVDQF